MRVTQFEYPVSYSPEDYYQTALTQGNSHTDST